MSHLEIAAAKIPGLLVGGRWKELCAVLRDVAPTLPACGDFVEVGCFAGQSTIALADEAQQAGRFVWAVDLFPSIQDWKNGFVMTADGTAAPLYPHGQEDIAKGGISLARDMVERHAPNGSQLEWFCENVSTAGYKHLIWTFQGTAPQFVAACPDRDVALAFLDGDHAYEATLADLQALDKVLLTGGVMILDDMEFPGVARAADEFFGTGYDTSMMHGYLVGVKR